MKPGNAATDDPVSQGEELTPLVEPIVAAAGFDLEELTVKRAGRRLLLRIVVDSDHGVTLDEAAAVSAAVSASLDAQADRVDVFRGESYTLEVTSPGVDRPLTQPRHWRRNTGRLINVQVPDGPLRGRIVAADGSGITLSMDGQTRTVPFGELGPGTVQLEFRRVTEENA